MTAGTSDDPIPTGALPLCINSSELTFTHDAQEILFAHNMQIIIEVLDVLL